MKKYFIFSLIVLLAMNLMGFSQDSKPNKELPATTEKGKSTDSLVKTLEGITVAGKTPLLQNKAGMMILNVAASPVNNGLTALELLEKSPGVSVDNDGKISLKGKQGVLILLDGKPTYMSAADLAVYLRNLQSNQIDQIEIMTNPPAKYDAAGNSGIINIKTKKGLKKGMNGNANFGYAQGVYGKWNGGVNLNYRTAKMNLFGSYSTSSAKRFNNLEINRNFYQKDKNTIDGSANQVSNMPMKNSNNSIKAGIDYTFGKKDMAGFVISSSVNDNDQRPLSITNVQDGAGELLYKLNSKGENIRKSTNVSANFNYKHVFDSTGHELSADADYIFYQNRNRSYLVTQGYTTQNELSGPPVLLKGDIPSDIDIYSFKLDYVRPFSKTVKLEAGIKTSIVNTDNQVNYNRNSGAGWIADERSNHFIYEENINAAYTVLSGTFKKWELTAGLRVENTHSKGHQLNKDSLFTRNYTNLFPNAGIQYKLNSKNDLSLGYSRRITRPDYEDLNPFVFFLDSLTYSQGNPYLQPQFTHNIELSHTYNNFLTTTLNYTHTNDIITQLLKQDTEKKLTYQTRENFNSMDQFGIAVSANMAIQKWWTVNAYVNVYNNRYDGIYQNDPVTLQFTSMTANMSHLFTFGKGWSGEISGWYVTKTAEGLLVINDIGSAGAGVSKQVFKGKGSFKLGLRDVFYTEQFSGYAKYSDVDVIIKGRKDSRQVSMTFNYRFGKKNLPSTRKKPSGAEEEQNRVRS